MKLPKFVIAGAAVGLALTLSGCGSDAASDAVSSAAAEVSEAVSSAAAEASGVASSVAAEASEAASSAMAEASEAISSAKAEVSGAANATYTLDDVAKHASSGDCWVAVNGNVYDLTKWEDQHPGGKDKIVKLCGTDATSAFSSQHDTQPAPNAALMGFQIGTLG